MIAIENLDAEVEIDHSMCLNSVAKEHEKLCTSAQKPIVNLGDSSLFNDCPLSLSSSAILIKKFQMKHGISQAALSDMLKLMKLLKIFFQDPYIYSTNICLFRLILWSLFIFAVAVLGKYLLRITALIVIIVVNP